jgi:hypothetical protein
LEADIVAAIIEGFAAYTEPLSAQLLRSELESRDYNGYGFFGSRVMLHRVDFRMRVFMRTRGSVESIVDSCCGSKMAGLRSLRDIRFSGMSGLRTRR